MGCKEQEAFDSLNHHITAAPVLAIPNFNKGWLIESDTTANGLKAILLKHGAGTGGGGAIAYFSKALGDRNLTTSTYEKEFMVVVLSIQHRWPYL